MLEDKSEWRKFKSKHSQYCLYGRCKDCSRVDESGRGIHDVEIYQVYKYTEETECDRCNGKGYIERECPHCDGLGTITEDCLDCSGNGQLPDLCGDEEFVREEWQLVKEKKGVEAGDNAVVVVTTDGIPPTVKTVGILPTIL